MAGRSLAKNESGLRPGGAITPRALDAPNDVHLGKEQSGRRRESLCRAHFSGADRARAPRA